MVIVCAARTIFVRNTIMVNWRVSAINSSLQVFIRLGKKREDFLKRMCYDVTVQKEVRA